MCVKMHHGNCKNTILSFAPRLGGAMPLPNPGGGGRGIAPLWSPPCYIAIVCVFHCLFPSDKITCSPFLQCSAQQQSLLWCLSLLDTVEVAIEVLTQRFAGEPSKWGVIILMQLFR